MCFAGGGGIATGGSSPFCFGRGGGITAGGGTGLWASRDGSEDSGRIKGRLSLSPFKRMRERSVSVSSSSGLAQAFPLRNLQGISYTEMN